MAKAPRRTRCREHLHLGPTRRDLFDFGGTSSVIADHLFGIVLAVPDRNAVAPPELARDAPVAQVVDPMEIGVFPVLRDQANFFLLDGRAKLFFKAGHLDKPLLGEIGLDDGFGAVGDADAVAVRLDFFEQA